MEKSCLHCICVNKYVSSNMYTHLTFIQNECSHLIKTSKGLFLFLFLLINLNSKNFQGIMLILITLSFLLYLIGFKMAIKNNPSPISNKVHVNVRECGFESARNG